MNCNLKVIFSTEHKSTCQQMTALCPDLYLMENNELNKVYALESWVKLLSNASK